MSALFWAAGLSWLDGVATFREIASPSLIELPVASACPVCDFDKPAFGPTPGQPDTLIVQCPRCGSYRISGTALATVPHLQDERYKLSGVLRNASQNGQQLRVTSDNLDELMGQAPTTFSISRLIEGILLLVADRTIGAEHLRKHVLLEANDYPLFYLKSGDDFFHIVVMLRDLKLLDVRALVGSSLPVALTVAGWERVDRLQSTRGRPDRAFVAMSFDTSLDKAYSVGIEPALRSTGFDPIRIDRLPHNERIDDKILAEIRTSGLVVADFTLHRQGVYFEAGFSLGLSIPVIWCCREDELGRAHFDTRQYSHILWTDPANLCEQLEARIRALGFART